MDLNGEEGRILCGIARNALETAVRGGEFRPPEPAEPALSEKRGCFVTLKTRGELRGCIGCFESDRPLYLTVAEYARHSALDDPRFAGRRIRPEELDTVDIEVSCLTPLRKCPVPEDIVPGRDGIYVRARGRSGCFLPQVATETGWNAEEFWGHCCRDKAGLEWDAWKRPDTECLIFTCEIFAC